MTLAATSLPVLILVLCAVAVLGGLWVYDKFKTFEKIGELVRGDASSRPGGSSLLESFKTAGTGLLLVLLLGGLYEGYRVIVPYQPSEAELEEERRQEVWAAAAERRRAMRERGQAQATDDLLRKLSGDTELVVIGSDAVARLVTASRLPAPPEPEQPSGIEIELDPEEEAETRRLEERAQAEAAQRRALFGER